MPGQKSRVQTQFNNTTSVPASLTSAARRQNDKATGKTLQSDERGRARSHTTNLLRSPQPLSKMDKANDSHVLRIGINFSRESEENFSPLRRRAFFMRLAPSSSSSSSSAAMGCSCVACARSAPPRPLRRRRRPPPPPPRHPPNHLFHRGQSRLQCPSRAQSWTPSHEWAHLQTVGCLSR